MSRARRACIPVACRPGFTLIELLVVIGVIALLVGLLVPAVQAARNAARRIQCVNNLKQLAIGVHGYMDSSSVLPPGQGGRGQSLFVEILPFSEGVPLYNSFNLDAGVHDASNRTSASARPSTLVCPSDAYQPYSQATNYAGNVGDAFYRGKFNGVFASTDDPSHKCVSPSWISDGMSGTVAMSEWQIGHPEAAPDRRRDIYGTAGDDDPERFAALCSSILPVTVRSTNYKGDGWHQGTWPKTLYDHFMMVNSPSCINKPGAPVSGACPSGSQHGGGANACFVDGHVQFVSQTVDAKVWRGLGTRAGGETISGDSY